MLEDKFALAASDAPDPVIIALYEAQAERRELGTHSHARGQLSGLRHGLLTIGTDEGAWIVPADHAIWLPPHQRHYGWTHGAVEGWSCYVSEATCTTLPDRPCTIRTSGLLREAVMRASSWHESELTPEQWRIAQVILDEVRAAPVDSFGSPMPRDPRLVRIARALLDDPSDGRTIQQWAQWAGVPERTLSRRFVVETGFTYTAWRQRACLMRALEMLAEGRAVTTVALDLGYDSVSAFIAFFKRSFGVTPSAYFRRA
jgi:AraC-like DNA-binding protein